MFRIRNRLPLANWSWAKSSDQRAYGMASTGSAPLCRRHDAPVLLNLLILAIQLFVALIEFKRTTLVGFVVIPLSIFHRSAFHGRTCTWLRHLVLYQGWWAPASGAVLTIDQAMAIVFVARALLGLGIKKALKVLRGCEPGASVTQPELAGQTIPEPAGSLFNKVKLVGEEGLEPSKS